MIGLRKREEEIDKDSTKSKICRQLQVIHFRISEFKPISKHLYIKIEIEDEQHIMQLYTSIEETEDEKMDPFYTLLHESQNDKKHYTWDWKANRKR